MKYFLGIFLLLTSCSTINKRKGADLSSTYKLIESRLNASEMNYDVKCWTSTKNISNLMFGFQTSDRAFHKREKMITAFAYVLWKFSQDLKSQKDLLSDKDIDEAFSLLTKAHIKQENTTTLIFLRIFDKNNRPLPPVKITALDYQDYGRTSNSWKSLYQLATDFSQQSGLRANLDQSAIDRLAYYIDTFAILLIKRSIDLAMEDGRATVHENHLLKSELSILIGGKIDGWSKGGEYAARSYAQAQNYAVLKMTNLEFINKKINAAQQKKVHEIIAGGELSKEGYAAFLEILKEFTEYIWRKSQLKTPKNNFLISGLDMYDTIQEILPYEMDDLSNMVFFANSDAPILYQEFESDTFRDDGYHWKIINDLMVEKARKTETDINTDKLIPLDIFAAEELTELISTYAVPLLKKGNEFRLNDKRNFITVSDVQRAHRFFLEYQQKHPEIRKEQSKNSFASHLPDYEEPIFKDVTKEFGIAPLKNPNELNDEVMKGATLMAFDAFRGVSTADFNRDGWMDLFIADEGGESRIYLNQEGRSFLDVSKDWNLQGVPGITSANPIDFNNDGCVDLFINRPYISSLLYQNTCKNGFKDITQNAGLGRLNIPTTGAIWFDYNNDGHLDLYILSTGDFKNGFLPMMGDVENALPNLLYRNNGDGTFTDKTIETGVGDKRIALAAAAFDYDNDGDQDLYVVNDMQRNILFENVGRGKFKDVSKKSKTDDLGNGMGVTVADINEDGLLDMFVTNITVWNPRARYIRPDRGTKVQSTKSLDAFVRSRQANRFFMNQGKGIFSDKAEELMPGFRFSSWGWNNFFFDFNNDSLQDLFIINGFRPESLKHHDEENLLLIQTPEDRKFHVLPKSMSGVGLASNSRGSLQFDMDNDGDLDLIVTGLHSPVLYRNETSKKNNWIEIRLRGKKSNRDAFGAKVEVRTQHHRQLLQQGSLGGGFVSYLNGPIHFGLGKSEEAQVKITWPSGKRTTKKVKANHLYLFEEI